MNTSVYVLHQKPEMTVIPRAYFRLVSTPFLFLIVTAAWEVLVYVRQHLLRQYD